MVRMAVVGSLILTVSAIIASYPATVFLLQYFADSQNTGALSWAASFLCLQWFCGFRQVGVGLRSIKPESLERARMK